MDKRELQKITKRYVAGECTPEEISMLERWFDLIGDTEMTLTNDELHASRNKMLRQVLLETSIERKLASLPARYPWYWAAAAVAFFLMLGSILYYAPPADDQYLSETQISDEQYTERSNTLRTVKKISLPDGSTVALEPNSVVRFASKFQHDKREVWLTGEAFFDVKRDSFRPFFVYGSNVVTQVLGTSFKVKALANTKTIEVEVKTGQVSVYQKNSTQDSSENNTETAGTNGVILTPNQKVVYYVKEDHWVTGLVDKPNIVSARKSKPVLIFEDTTLPEIVEMMERDYGIEFVLDNANIRTCTFTGDVSGMSLYDALDVITKSIAAKYELRGTKILITGQGCDQELH